MYLPPADAVIMNNAALRELNNGKYPTYAQYRIMEKELLAYSAAIDKQAQEQAQAFMRGSKGNGTLTTQTGSMTKYSTFMNDAQLKRYNNLKDKILPAACGASVMSLGAVAGPGAMTAAGFPSYGNMKEVHSSSTSCTASDGSAGAYCWMQCVALSTVSPSCSATNIECVDTSHNNVVVNGNDHCPGTSMSTSCQLQCVGVPTYAPTKAPAAISTGSGSSSSSSSSSDGCFSGSETVSLESGESKLISEVLVGDRILSADAAGKMAYSEVVAVPHAKNEIQARFIQLVTESGRDVKMTGLHMVPAGSCSMSGDLPLIYASAVKMGDCIKTVDGLEKVVGLKESVSKGIYTVVAMNEYVVVNGVVASPFAISHVFANVYYNLYRMVYAYFPNLLLGGGALNPSEEYPRESFPADMSAY
jgi:Hint module